MSQLRRTKAVFCALALTTLCGHAFAQDALGDGSALDANTGQNGRKNFQRPSLASELSFRNAIATGNAPGGLSFRGDLGYRAAGEFTGELGSDSLFAFRRDSLYSGLAGMGIRGTDAIQYQFALTTGAAPTRNLMGNLSTSRDNYYSSYTNSYGQTETGSSIRYDQEREDLDQRGKQLSAYRPTQNASYSGVDTGSMLGTLRSASTYTTTNNLQPALLSVYTEGVDRKAVGLIASPLLGVTSTPMAEDEPEINPLVARPPNGVNSGQVSNRLPTSYEGLVEQMRDHVEKLRTDEENAQSTIRSDETNDSWLIRQMQDLREKLYGAKPANDDDPNNTDLSDPMDNPKDNPESTDPEEVNDPNVTLDPRDYLPENSNSPLSQAIQESLKNISSDTSTVELYDPTVMAIDPETLQVLRGSSAREIDQLLDPRAADRDIYGEHMVTGQRLIAEGRYFDAEERFTHALSINPGDIPAQLGRLHAQIGAGMVLSASVNLQSLFSMHPEVVASKYSGKLLPDQNRIIKLTDRLKERAGLTTPELSMRLMESDRIRVSAGILLAYLGYQINDDQMVSEGLAVVKERGDDSDQRFSSLLSQVWGLDLGAGESTSESSSTDTTQESD
ncbi:MAG: hypothetical protein P1U42_01455 [Phycisphaerales bacterium]|nr:hypothetical protein [Phycisphaerales bacterium]